ncbi:unnamed protein product [Rotaria sp. Silwood2]|nr:unnamed protein product [Rotaria sp. Silwood2]
MTKASNYLNIYQECSKRSWNDIPNLLYRIPVALSHYAIDKRQPNDVTKMIKLMYTLNNRLNGKAQVQIDGFQEWLTHTTQTNQTNDNIEDEDPNNQLALLQKSQERHTQMQSVEV